MRPAVRFASSLKNKKSARALEAVRRDLNDMPAFDRFLLTSKMLKAPPPMFCSVSCEPALPASLKLETPSTVIVPSSLVLPASTHRAYVVVIEPPPDATG